MGFEFVQAEVSTTPGRAPVMMVAEKAADLILGNTPLAPSTAAFYRRATGHRDERD